MTSVKDVRVDEPPTRDAPGRGRFSFTDDYSVFDWGKMPDRVPRKGAALCTMGAYNFELLDVNHIPTHYEGVMDPGEDGGVVDLGNASGAPTEMALTLVRVPDLPFEGSGYDYDAYHDDAGTNYIVPLEIVFRNTVPVGSSLRSRGDPTDYSLDYDAWPDRPVDLPEPVVEFSTKYEEKDRYLDYGEADRIAGDVDAERLEELALAVSHVVTEQAERGGFTHQDGKIECAYIDGTVAVADVVGTFDENRFGYGGQQVSKEVIRQYYKRHDPAWVDAVADAKAAADERGVADWRPLCAESPDPLPEGVIEAVSDLYCAGANAYTEAEWFDAPDIEAAVDAVRDL